MSLEGAVVVWANADGGLIVNFRRNGAGRGIAKRFLAVMVSGDFVGEVSVAFSNSGSKGSF